jgi:hypothetical protein
MKKSKPFIWSSVAVTAFACMMSFLFISHSLKSNQIQSADLASSATLAEAPLGSYELVQRVFDQRCIACHSCNNAPCQLKLTDYEGFTRGMSQTLVYEPTRLKALDPTRLGIDAQSDQAWRAKGFHSVHESSETIANSPFFRALKSQITEPPAAAVALSHTCPVNPIALEKYLQASPLNLMPYGLPPLEEKEKRVLTSWVEKGSKPPTKIPSVLPATEQQTLMAWQSFLNKNDLNGRLVARYMYEHLFQAHLYLDAKSLNFHRLIRSRTACDSGMSEIATRRPTDDPGPSMYYCFQRYAETIVEKTHLTYLMDDKKLARVKEIFFAEPWQAKDWPGYANALNPFITFEAIPVKARYRFLLEDSKYHVGTFIKGPVCNGAVAVDSIDENFFVLFMNPDSELMVRDPQFARSSQPELILPAEGGSQTGKVKMLTYLARYVKAERAYKALKRKSRDQLFPNGYALTDFWNGDEQNPNAALTVFRHFDNSYVLQGLQGGMSNTVFVLDYSLFERLVYNLSVGFDVFGTISHQLHTRIYMGLIRRESEDNFLNFLAPEARRPLFKRYYEGMFPAVEAKVLGSEPDLDFPTQIKFDGIENADTQLIRKIVNERLSDKVLSTRDTINTRLLTMPATQLEFTPPIAPIESFKQLSQVPSSLAPFVGFMPDVSLLLVQQSNKVAEVYTLIRNKAHSSLGLIFLESKYRDPANDTLSIVKGLAASYPNYFYLVNDKDVARFAAEMLQVKSRAEYGSFNQKWGVARKNPSFWKISDSLHEYLRRVDPTEFGYLDYTHYDVWSEVTKDPK